LPVFLAPDIGQSVLLEQHRHIEDVELGGEREIAAELASGTGEAIESSSECTASMVPRCMARNKLARGHDLVGKEQLDLQLAIGVGVVVVDGRLGHVLAKRAPA
jgi:hypothetical protein